MDSLDQIIAGDCLEGLKGLPDGSVNCCVTSPPYWNQRDYGVPGQYGLEGSPEAYVAQLVAVFAEVKRVLRSDGTLWLNLGDAYWGSGKAGSNPAYQARHKEFGKVSGRQAAFGVPTNRKHASLKPKDLIGLPWTVAFALRESGWYLRQDLIWHKPNPMPESTTDRCVKAHEYLFLLSKSQQYHFDHVAIRQPAKTKEARPFGVVRDRQLDYNSKQKVLRPNVKRGYGGDYTPAPLLVNKRSVWTVPTRCFKGAHFATFPEELIRDCIVAGCPPGGVVLDPFMGAGTTAVVAKALGRHYTGFELNPAYVALAKGRLAGLEQAEDGMVY